MSDIIRLLPDSVANQIAAGEVIQRPASVVKELVENAVDAGATGIQIIIKDAGRTLIQVVDNGRGMSPTDARMAFERHATSKILAADDLFALRTMGFRGEALASVCAVAQVELHTRAKDEQVGTKLIINGSVIETQEPDACASGTNMMVRNLFFNVPARRKFLKKDSVEMSNIIHEFERLALVNPGLEMSLVHNGITLHQLTRGSLLQRIGQLFGRSVEKQLIPLETSTPIVTIRGHVGLPGHARRRGALQYLFVNGRNMRHPYFHKAIMHCYERLIAPDVQPNYFIDFEVDPATIDVNIHPTKNEIKFENEQAIWQILDAAVRESLGRFDAIPAIEFGNADAPEIPVFNPTSGAAGMTGFESDPTYNPFAETDDTTAPQPRRAGGDRWRDRASAATDDWEKLYRSFTGSDAAADGGITRPSRLNDDPSLAAPDNAATIPGIDAPRQTTLMQIKGRYIVAPAKSGLMLIDQYRAHVRILYERFIASARHDGGVASQQVMFAEVMRLSASQNVIMESITGRLERLGFSLSPLGDNTWSINGIPDAIAGMNPTETLTAIIDDIAADSGVSPGDDIAHRLALSMARSAAIRPGQTLSTADMERLISDLFALPSPNYTPDGNTVVKLLSIDDISAMF